MNNANWKTTKAVKKCNAFPMVWAAIYGCTGEQTGTWRYSVGSFGRREVDYACPVCKAAKDLLDAASHSEYQRLLTEAQAKAGVQDYRTARVKLVNGVPTIVR